MRRLARGGSEFQTAYSHLAIDTPQAEFEAARAFALSFEFARHVLGKILHHPIEQLAVANGFEQTALNQRHRLRNHWQQRLGHAAEQLVEPDERIGGGRPAVAKTALDGIAAYRTDFTQLFEAETTQHGDHVLVEP